VLVVNDDLVRLHLEVEGRLDLGLLSEHDLTRHLSLGHARIVSLNLVEVATGFVEEIAPTENWVVFVSFYIGFRCAERSIFVAYLSREVQERVEVVELERMLATLRVPHSRFELCKLGLGFVDSVLSEEVHDHEKLVLCVESWFLREIFEECLILCRKSSVENSVCFARLVRCRKEKLDWHRKALIIRGRRRWAHL
jgi:hypothetical protein